MKKIAAFMAVVVFFLSGCSAWERPDPTQYATYECYDRYLACIKTYSQTGTTRILEGEGDVQWSLTFSKPVGTSDDQFICVKSKRTLVSGIRRDEVWQNPDNYVDVFQEWTVKKIELFRSHDIVSSENTAVIEDFLAFVVQNNQPAEERNPLDAIEDEQFSIRVYFYEAENIVWESKVQYYFSEKNQQRYIKIFKEQKRNMPNQSDEFSVPINEHEDLYNWISASVDGWK